VNLVHQSADGSHAVRYETGNGSYVVVRRRVDGWDEVVTRDWHDEAVELADALAAQAGASDFPELAASEVKLDLAETLVEPAPRLRLSALAARD
jgi:hypothetical protein